MNLRFKFLTFLGVFLLGAFLIITWKSFNIFSQKYTMAMAQAELQKLEVQAHTVAQRFQGFQIAVSDGKELEPQLKGLGVQLLAHVIKEEGKWKAQWFEGSPGARQSAQNATQQIPFDSLSTSRKSWHLYQTRTMGSGVAYVIPSLNNAQMSFYVFFLNKDFFSRIFQGQSQQDSISLVSPYVGEIYSSGDSAASESLEKYKKNMMDQQSGVASLGHSRSLVFLFNPDLQLYLVKSKRLAELTVDKPMYLATLGLIMLILIGIALYAMDLLLRKVLFEEVELAVDAAMAAAVESGATLSKESPAATEPAPAAKNEEMEKLLEQLRPKAINSLGYVHKVKQAHSSPHLVLLETELREIRHLIDPIAGAAAKTPEKPAAQPTFNPFLKENFTSSSTNSSVDLTVDFESSENQILIRKPKRESHESR